VRLIAYQDDRLLWETDDGHGRVTDESGSLLTVDPDQSVESIMSRGYWKVLPHVAKHASEVHPGTGTNQKAHAGLDGYSGPGGTTGSPTTGQSAAYENARSEWKEHLSQVTPEWEEDGPGEWNWYSDMGTYHIRQPEEGDPYEVTLDIGGGDTDTRGVFDSLEAAQAAAFSDYGAVFPGGGERPIDPKAQEYLDEARDLVSRVGEALAGRGPAFWAASMEDVAAGRVPGLRYRQGGEHAPEASWAYDHIVVSDKFFDLSLPLRRLVIAHEVGHNLADAFMFDDTDTMWTLAESGAMGERHEKDGRFVGIWGPNGHSKPEEILAEAYSILWTEGDGGPEWLRDWRGGELYEAVVAAAERYGFALPEGVGSAPADEDRRFFAENPDEYRGTHQPSGDYGAPGHDLTAMVGDIYEHPEYLAGHRQYPEVMEVMQQVRGNPDAEVTVYRAVPEGVTDINPGDWVTPSRAYAELHGDSNLAGPDGDRPWSIVERTVKAGELMWPGDYIPEFGWFPEEAEAQEAVSLGPWQPTDTPLDLHSIEGRGSTPARLTRTEGGKKKTTVKGEVPKSAVQARAQAVLDDMASQLGVEFPKLKLHWDVDEFWETYHASGGTNPNAAAYMDSDEGVMHIGPGVLRDMVDLPNPSAYLVVAHEALHTVQSVQTMRGSRKNFGEAAAELLAFSYGLQRLDLTEVTARYKVPDGETEEGYTTYREARNPADALIGSRAYVDRMSEAILHSARRVGWDRQAILTDITDTFLHGSDDDWTGFYQVDGKTVSYAQETRYVSVYGAGSRTERIPVQADGYEAADAAYAAAEAAGVPLDLSYPNWKDFAWDTANAGNDYKMQRTPEAEEQARRLARSESLILWLLGADR
jgi:hypothetical protein